MKLLILPLFLASFCLGAAEPDEPPAPKQVDEAAVGEFIVDSTRGLPDLFSKRRGDEKRQVLFAGGGSATTEAAIDAALRYLVRHQSPNGGWEVVGHGLNCKLPGPKSEPGTRHTGADGDAAATGYALLAFLAAGHDHRNQSRYRGVVAKGVEWLVANQRQDGGFGRGRNYENGICTLALIEAMAMSQDRALRQPVSQAVGLILSRQNTAPHGNSPLGWCYTVPKARNDSSVSGWTIAALKSAAGAGMRVDQGLKGAQNYFVGAWNAANNNGQGIIDPHSDRSGFPYTWDSQSNASNRDDRIAIGLSIAMMVTPGKGDIRAESLANELLIQAFDNRNPHFQLERWPVNTYNLYYASKGLATLGDERWDRWRDAAFPLLLKNQIRSDDCLDGSWDFAGTLFHGHQVGRLFSTAYCALTLQTPYRYNHK